MSGWPFGDPPRPFIATNIFQELTDIEKPGFPATIIIPQHGQSRLTVDCIASHRRYESIRWPILIIDDGSPAADIATVKAMRDEQVTVITQPHVGVTAAWNRAAHHAATPVLVFLNNDVIFQGPVIEELTKPLIEHSAVITGARLRQENALPPHIVDRLPTTEFLEGWCFAVLKETWSGLGGFDESMRLYFSDTDFQARAILHQSSAQSLIAMTQLPLRHLGHRTAHRLPHRNAQWRADRDAFVKKWT